MYHAAFCATSTKKTADGWMDGREGLKGGTVHGRQTAKYKAYRVVYEPSKVCRLSENDDAPSPESPDERPRQVEERDFRHAHDEAREPAQHVRAAKFF